MTITDKKQANCFRCDTKTTEVWGFNPFTYKQSKTPLCKGCIYDLCGDMGVSPLASSVAELA